MAVVSRRRSRYFPSRARQVPRGVVVVAVVVAVAPEEVRREVEEAAHRDESVEEVGAPEEGVRGVKGAEAGARGGDPGPRRRRIRPGRGDDLLLEERRVERLLAGLLGDVDVGVRPGPAVDRVDGDGAEAPGEEKRLDRLDEPGVLGVEVISRVGRKEQERPPGASVERDRGGLAERGALPGLDPARKGRVERLRDQRPVNVAERLPRNAATPSFPGSPPSAERVLVRARPVDGRDGNVEEPEVDRELSSVMVRVVEEDRPKERDPRHRQERLRTLRERPRFHRHRVVHLGHRPLRGRAGRLEALHDLGGRRGDGGRGRSGREVEAALQNRHSDEGRDRREVLGQLPEAPRLRVRLPPQLRVGAALQELPRRSRLPVELHQQGVDHPHRILPHGSSLYRSLAAAGPQARDRRSRRPNSSGRSRRGAACRRRPPREGLVEDVSRRLERASRGSIVFRFARTLSGSFSRDSRRVRFASVSKFAICSPRSFLEPSSGAEARRVRSSARVLSSMARCEAISRSPRPTASASRTRSRTQRYSATFQPLSRATATSLDSS